MNFLELWPYIALLKIKAVFQETCGQCFRAAKLSHFNNTVFTLQLGLWLWFALCISGRGRCPGRVSGVCLWGRSSALTVLSTLPPHKSLALTWQWPSVLTNPRGTCYKKQPIDIQPRRSRVPEPPWKDFPGHPPCVHGGNQWWSASGRAWGYLFR